VKCVQRSSELVCLIIMRKMDAILSFVVVTFT